MMIIGCDYHPGFQQIAFVDTESGKLKERRLGHREEAERFYRDLEVRGVRVRVGMEASGHARWFERLLAGLQFELWIGDAAEDPHEAGAEAEDGSPGCATATDVADGRSLPEDLGTEWGKSRSTATPLASTPDGADAYAHHESVACGGIERRGATQEGAVAAGRRAQLESLVLARWASRRRQDLLELLDQLTPRIQELTRALEEEVEKRPVARRLMRHPGVGPLTALAFVLIIGKAERFGSGKQIASYLGLVPLEESSGNRRRLGHITKQGRSMLRFLLVEAAQVTARSVPECSKYLHLMMRRGRKTAKVAMARRLAVRLYWMMRQEWDYQQWNKFGSHAGQPGHRAGVQ